VVGTGTPSTTRATSFDNLKTGGATAASPESGSAADSGWQRAGPAAINGLSAATESGRDVKVSVHFQDLSAALLQQS
jgi:hypothetical protein